MWQTIQGPNINYDAAQFDNAVDSTRSSLEELKLTPKDEDFVLGSTVMPKAIRECLGAKSKKLAKVSDRLRLIDSHSALFLLKNYSFCSPKIPLNALHRSVLFRAGSHR